MICTLKTFILKELFPPSHGGVRPRRETTPRDRSNGHTLLLHVLESNTILHRGTFVNGPFFYGILILLFRCQAESPSGNPNGSAAEHVRMRMFGVSGLTEAIPFGKTPF